MGKCQDLLEAARNGNIAVVCKILELCAKKGGPLSSFRRSPSINWQDVNGYTPLHHACLNGHIEIVRLLLAHDAAIDMPDIRGSTPLYLAAWAGHQEIVKMLLMHPLKPANPNAQTSENETALHCAAQHGHNAVVAILLAYGADPTIRNNSFQTPMDLASHFGRLQVVQILIRTHPELIEPFRLYDEAIAMENGHSPPYTITPTKHIFTHSCLHLAARNGHKKVVETLLAAGVDVNILTHAGSALHEAALCGKKSVVCTLLRAGIDPYAVDGNGRTAMDLLKDYPPHVTYEIVSIINDFCQDSSKMVNKTHFMPIKDVNDNTTITNYEDESEKVIDQISDRYEQQSITTKNAAPFDVVGSHLLGGVQSDLDTSCVRDAGQLNSCFLRQISTDRYTPMEPILYPRTYSNRSTPEHILEYKPIYTPTLLNRRLGDNVTHFPKLTTNFKMDQDATPQYACVDEYVEMSMPPFSPRTPVTQPSQHQHLDSQTPLPSPRGNVEYGDYANISIINKAHSSNNMHAITSTDDHHIIIRISSRSESYDSNNNNNNNDERKQSNERDIHSPTPDYPPPSALQAESAIFEFVKPPEKVAAVKRKSLRLQNCNSQFYDGLKSFIWEDQMEPGDEEQFDSLSSSRISECVEEFVGDVPFAGLFKGSSLNLTIDSQDSEKPPAPPPPPIKNLPSGLRSPSLVRSVKPVPAKRTVTIQSPSECKMESEFEFDASKVWDEINTIFESIGNEVAATDAKLEAISNESNSLSNTLRKKTLTIRKPADLLLGSPSPSQEHNAVNPNWCHSANILIYSYVLYDVYYLGSTVVRELHGTASTRKSIQKLKREDTPARQIAEANGLIQDINSSTRILKGTTEQTRLKVSIGISHAGVRFIDSGNRKTICVHDIENINCVSQDTDDLRYFAYITREKDINYCHVFTVDRLDLATEIILTLGQAFEVAYQLSLVNKEESPGIISSESTFVEDTNKRLSCTNRVDNV